MPKQKIEFEIDIPENYEFSRIERWPRVDNLAADERIIPIDENGCICAIIRKAWQWPEWLIAPWIAMDGDGEWWAFGSKPRIAITRWVIDGDGDDYLQLDRGNFINFAPPVCNDWTKSLSQNPRNIKAN